MSEPILNKFTLWVRHIKLFWKKIENQPLFDKTSPPPELVLSCLQNTAPTTFSQQLAFGFARFRCKVYPP